MMAANTWNHRTMRLSHSRRSEVTELNSLASVESLKLTPTHRISKANDRTPSFQLPADLLMCAVRNCCLCEGPARSRHSCLLGFDLGEQARVPAPKQSTR